MNIRINFTASLGLLVSSLSTTTLAFSPRGIAFNNVKMSQNTRLDMRNVSEESAMDVMLRARECAGSESCSIEMANEYLLEVVQVQSGCAAGTLNGAALCDDVLFSSEVIANLRAKIEKGSANSDSFWSSRQSQLENMVMASSSSDGATLSPLAGLTKAPLEPLYLGIAAFYAVLLISSLNNGQSAALPFTAEEWWWAARDGYLSDMLVHALKNGGLAAVSTANNGELAPVSFTGQEWWWAARDGYLNDMVHHAVKNGGLVPVSSMNNDEISSLPFTAQEWWWAARDGYLNNMVVHAFRNGGV